MLSASAGDISSKGLELLPSVFLMLLVKCMRERKEKLWEGVTNRRDQDGLILEILSLS